MGGILIVKEIQGILFSAKSKDEEGAPKEGVGHHKRSLDGHLKETKKENRDQLQWGLSVLGG